MPPHIVNPDRVKPFATEAAFEEWLAANHASEKEVWIRIYKTGSGVPTITPVQAIDVALCWGWIDGVRKSLDETSFLQRYTPRKAKSVWSQINRDNVARLTAAGRMTPHGQRHVDRATADGRLDAAPAPTGDTTETIIPADLRVAISADQRAFETFKRLSRPGLSELASRTNGMKTPLGRAKKISELVALLAAGGTIVPEQTAPERTQPDPASASPAKAEGPADTPKQPARAKAKPAKGKAAAPKRTAQAKAKPTKGKAAAPKRTAQAKAKPTKGKAAAPKRTAQAKKKPKGKAAASKRPARSTRAATAKASPPRKAKAKKAPASKKKAKR
jgi:uncharacterized protein YdeI (YjbR/CyaY-like superfamily)